MRDGQSCRVAKIKDEAWKEGADPMWGLFFTWNFKTFELMIFSCLALIHQMLYRSLCIKLLTITNPHFVFTHH